MNVIDIAILAVLVAFIVKGLMRGFLRELCSIVGLVAGAYLAMRFHPPLAQWMAQTFSLPINLCVFAGFVVLLLVTILFFAILGHLLSHFFRFLFSGGFNRVTGGLFGLCQGVLILSILLFAVSARPWPESVEPALKESELAPPFVNLGETVFRGGSRILSGDP
jgi:membrane protein required for colicin V production